MIRFIVGTVILYHALAYSAQAATSFDFSNLGGADEALSWNVLSADGSITVSLSAPDGELGATDLSGFGVRSAGSVARPLANNEVLRVDFNTTVNLGVISLAQWDSIDQISLTDSNEGVALILNGDTCLTCSEESFTIDLIGIDYLELKGISATTSVFLLGFSEVTIVPVPAAAWLFGSALLALVSLGYKRGLAS